MTHRARRSNRSALLIAIAPLALGGLVLIASASPAPPLRRHSPTRSLSVAVEEHCAHEAERLPAPVHDVDHGDLADPAKGTTDPIRSEEALLRGVEDVLRTEGEEWFESGRAEAMFEAQRRSTDAPLSCEGIVRLLALLDAQSTPSRSGFLAFVLRVATETGRLTGTSSRERGVLVARLADAVLRERDPRLGRVLIGALRYAGWEAGDAREGLDALARVVEDAWRSADERDEAAVTLAEAASLGDAGSLQALRRLAACPQDASSASALDALAIVAGARPGEEKLRRSVVSSLEALPAEAVAAHWRAIEALAQALSSDASRFRAALLAGSLVERSIAVAALSGRAEPLDADEREVLFRIAEGDGPAWLRAEVLDRLIAEADDDAAGERLARLAGALFASAPDEMLRQRAEVVLATLPAHGAAREE